ncbi:MAG: SCO family protein [Flavobacteriales bacterium]|nr:SCO family protein [Flavobacteriales bacterium]
MFFQYFKRYKYFIISFVLFSVIVLTLYYNALNPPKRLPIYSPAEVNPELVDTSIQHVKKYHTIADFSFINQYRDTITQEDFKGKVYIADFFFTTCPTICPIMTKNMSGLQKELMRFPEVKLLSHTVMPHIDSVSVIKAYGDKHGAIKDKWHLVTGNKKDIYYTARKSYMVVKTSEASELYDMVHTENFVLVDTKRRVRGYYDGTNEEEMVRLLEDIEWLIQNPNN